MKLGIFDLNGQPTGEEVELSSAVFEIEPNDHAIAMAVTVEQSNRRQGNHATKSRNMVRGGGRKPWRQKGRGVARAGTIRSPLWRGGGIIFGPHPHLHKMKINKKMNRLARRSALAYKAKDQSIKVLTDFAWDDGKTTNARNLLKAFNITTGSVLLLTSEYSSSIYQSCRNVVDFEVIKASDVSARQILKCQTLFIQKSAVSPLQEVLTK